MRQNPIPEQRVRRNHQGSHSLYAGSEEIIRGLTEEDVVNFYMEMTGAPSKPPDLDECAPPSGQSVRALPKTVIPAQQQRERRRGPPPRRGRPLALLPHADFVRKAMDRNPNIRPMTMALLLNQYGVKVHSLNPVRSIMEYCER
ncbi:hypothetical protein [Methylobacterium durans]|uniref:hypothetical protein n=1 Tax=Methylobacterium durans TaxID=2202825 RepID=UPI0013A5AA89|nr:hypothetical protein [Methylobacterium durans]